jgi:CubicO group peptidase (beta-lactamase class C family)
MARFDAVRQLLTEGIAARSFPAAALEVGTRSGVTWRTAAGRLAYEPESPPAGEDTIFDLASLTKVIASASAAMRLVETGRLGLPDRVSAHLSAWQGQDRAHVVVRDLLEHCAGLTAWMPFHQSCTGTNEVTRAICELPLEYAPWTQAVYSDLGFMLLGDILETAGGQPLDVQVQAVTAGLELAYRPPAAWTARTAPTGHDAWRGRLLVGEVHDENAWALEGVAGHAGLFGSAAAVGGFARLVLRTFHEETALGRPDTLERFVTRSTVPRSSRALGWDTMLPTSSCGTRMSPRAVGHTGFTGTSLWIDPARDVYVVLLTNRVHPTRKGEGLKRLRPLVHDAVLADLG